MQLIKVIFAGVLFCAFAVIAATKGYWKIDPAKCNGCSACVDVCETNAIKEIVVNGRTKYMIDSVLCTDCGKCDDECNKNAISRVESKPTSVTNLAPNNSAKVTTFVQDGELLIRGVTQGNVQIIDLKGRVLAEKNINATMNSISVRSIPHGVVFVKCTANRITTTEKIGL